jgi:hypothetical protein
MENKRYEVRVKFTRKQAIKGSTGAVLRKVRSSLVTRVRKGIQADGEQLA